MFCHPEHTMVTKTSHYKTQAHQCLPCFDLSHLIKNIHYSPWGFSPDFKTSDCPSHLPLGHSHGTNDCGGRAAASLTTPIQAAARLGCESPLTRNQGSKQKTLITSRGEPLPKHSVSWGRKWAKVTRATFFRNAWFLHHLHAWRNNFLTLRATEKTSLCWSIWVDLDVSQQQMGHSGDSSC